MQTKSNNSAKTSKNIEPFTFQEKIGSTVYNVTVNFSQTSKETIEDKMIRLIENEVRNIA